MRLVQQALIDLGFPPSEGATGVFSAQTGEAVLAYRTDRGIRGEGGRIFPIVGQKTIRSLDAGIAAFDRAAQGSRSPAGARSRPVTTRWLPAGERSASW